MTEELHFSIDGEWLTDILRTWFWDENRSFDKCMDMVSSCMIGADSELIRNVTTDLLEHRKKFVGANNFQLVDDIGPIRPITEKVALLQRRIDTQNLRDDMCVNFIKYVDQWATTKSMHPQSLDCNGNPKTYEECRDYFGSVKNFFGRTIMLESRLNEPTECGLWLYHDIPLVYHIVYELNHKAGSHEFWEDVYHAKKNDPGFEDRTARYEAYIRRQEERNQMIRESAIPNEESVTEETNNQDDYWTPAWFDRFFQKEKDINYNLHPDDIDQWEGLISPTGDFYSCTFGGHNIKAYHLMLAYPEKFGMPPDKTDDDRFERARKLDMDKALDKVLALGWCATRFLPTCGEYIDLPTAPKQATKRQKDCIYDAIIKHDAKVDTIDLFND